MPASKKEQNAETAIEALQNQIELADGNLDSIDRKAALIPAALAGISAIFLPESFEGYNRIQIASLLEASAFGLLSVLFALYCLRTRSVVIGPDVDKLVMGLDTSTEDYKTKVAGSLALAVNELTLSGGHKAKQVNRSMTFASISILFIVLSRVAGALPMTDQPNSTDAPAPSPTAQPSGAPAASPEPSGATSTPAAKPADTPGASEAAPASYPNFGEQWAAKGGDLPPNVEYKIVQNTQSYTIRKTEKSG